MATWTTMNDLGTGDLVTEADMDAIRGNIEYLLDPDMDEVDALSAFFASSASWTYVTGSRATLTTHGGKVLYNAIVSGYISTANSVAVTLYIDGTVISGTVKTLAMVYDNAGMSSMNFQYIADGLSAASHTFDMYAQVDGGSGQVLVHRIQVMEF